MKWRRITEDEVRSVLEHPDKVEQSIRGRTNVYKRISERYIKVTYREYADRILVISAVNKGEGG